jgi:prepilin-type N-terminal cleavage/methylation domain-containing protein
MSDRSRSRDDAGFTLPELLISVVVLGLIVGVISAGIIVTMRTANTSKARTALAVDQQFVATYLPYDLASATAYSTSTTTAGTPPPVLNGIGLPGTNVLELTWKETVGGNTKYYAVSYRYVKNGTSFELWRYRCEASTPTGFTAAACTSVVVARNLVQPANPGTWTSGDPVPAGAVTVTKKPGGGLTDITMTIGLAGGGSTTTQFTVGAGGLSEGKTVAPVRFEDTSFAGNNTRCGKRILLVVDTSTSVPVNAGAYNVLDAVKAFVDAFKGTPTQLGVLAFDRLTYEIAPRSGLPAGYGGSYVAMRTVGATNSITTWANTLRLDGNDNTSGHDNDYYLDDPNNDNVFWGQKGDGTNWDDALFRSIYDGTGVTPGNASTYNNPVLLSRLPDTIVFVTDGEPNKSRGTAIPSSGRGDVNRDAVDVSLPGSVATAARALGIKVIGIGVGDSFNYVYPAPTTVSSPTPFGDLSSVAGNTRWNQKIDATSNASVATLFYGNYANLGNALTAIFQADCGGTITVGSSNAPGALSYTTDVDLAPTVISTRQDTAGGSGKESATFDYVFPTSTSSPFDTARINVALPAGVTSLDTTQTICSTLGTDLGKPGRYTVGASYVTVQIFKSDAISCDFVLAGIPPKPTSLSVTTGGSNQQIASDQGASPGTLSGGAGTFNYSYSGTRSVTITLPNLDLNRQSIDESATDCSGDVIPYVLDNKVIVDLPAGAIVSCNIVIDSEAVLTVSGPAGMKYTSAGVTRTTTPASFTYQLGTAPSTDFTVDVVLPSGHVRLDPATTCGIGVTNLVVTDTRITGTIAAGANASCTIATVRTATVKVTVNGVTGAVVSSDGAATPGQVTSPGTFTYEFAPSDGTRTVHLSPVTPTGLAFTSVTGCTVVSTTSTTITLSVNPGAALSCTINAVRTATVTVNVAGFSAAVVASDNGSAPGSVTGSGTFTYTYASSTAKTVTISRSSPASLTFTSVTGCTVVSTTSTSLVLSVNPGAAIACTINAVQPATVKLNITGFSTSVVASDNGATPATVTNGGTFTYQFISSTSKTVTLSMVSPTPADVIFGSVTGCTVVSTTTTTALVAVSPGANLTCTVNALRTATVKVTVNGFPAAVVASDNGAGTVTSGGTFTYTYASANPKSVVISRNLPANLTFTSISGCTVVSSITTSFTLSVSPGANLTCNVNAMQPATVKVIVNGFSTAVVASDNGAGTVTSGGTFNYQFTSVNPKTVTISKNSPSDLTFTSVTGCTVVSTTSTAFTLSVNPGDADVCTVNAARPATINLIVNGVSGAMVSSSGSTSPAQTSGGAFNYLLTSSSFTDVTLTEVTPVDMVFTSVSCTSGLQSSQTGPGVTGSAVVRVNPGDNITCTINAVRSLTVSYNRGSSNNTLSISTTDLDLGVGGSPVTNQSVPKSPSNLTLTYLLASGATTGTVAATMNRTLVAKSCSAGTVGGTGNSFTVTVTAGTAITCTVQR